MKKKRKILLVFGTRPEAIKMAPLVICAQNYCEKLSIQICTTGQHRQMLDQAMDLFQITPDFDLNIMKPGQSLAAITSAILVGLDLILRECVPDLVLVHGDTSTAFASTLCAFYQRVPVGHVEAGLRTGNIYSPWPEEANRLLVSNLAKFHFAPTVRSQKNLLQEGKPAESTIMTGNTVVDALQYIVKRLDTEQRLRQKIKENLSLIFKDRPEKVRLIAEGHLKFILVTGHRRENFGKGFENICLALRQIAQSAPDIQIIYPVHMNPNVRQPVKDLLRSIENIQLVEPLEYEFFIYLLSKCHFVITDSGGIQEEAPSFGKPVLVMRDSTERPEAIEAGTARLVGTNYDQIVAEALKILYVHGEYNKMAKAINPFGDGNASNRIWDFLTKENLVYA